MQPSTARFVARSFVILGPVIAGLIAWATSAADDSIGIANTALALAFVCVAAALLHPLAGVTTSLAAALGLNYFHTVPVHSLRMTDSSEIVTVLLLMLLGLSVSVITTLRVRSHVTAHRTDAAAVAAAHVIESLERGAPMADVWRESVDANAGEAASLMVRLVSSAPNAMPSISTRAEADDVVLVPETGASLSLDGGGALILTPAHGMGSVTASRTALRQFAAQIAAILSTDARPTRAA